MNKEIKQFNYKNQLHGYQEWYYINNNPRLKGNFKNNRPVGYVELHYYKQTYFYI